MAKELTVALIQSHLIWENPESNRALFSEQIDSISDDVDVIILPEMFTTGFTMRPQNVPFEEKSKTIAWMQEWARKKDAAIVGSIIDSEEGKFYNRFWFVAPEGMSTYDKKHTFTLAGEDKVYHAGTSKAILVYRGFKICPLICYDLRFPVWARNVEGYDVLIYVANWPKPRISAWDTLLKARAIENMAYCIGVNRIGKDSSGHEYSGHSAVYDVLGNPLAYSEKDEILYATLSKEHIDTYRNKLRFLEDRDEFSLL
ncbi:amidohydrolase [Muricauda sp. SCSIO 64092]|uniref:amidohydrolase n=1 Tax=Allomuricauda sp. SCSIO 64092 TaxID=2908842 RepID=UPI001FF29A15|nr:amidohydrolase [Muricauda sp. SCSIO 64092]UOY09208.1 amidohydrolase [Muricauda sp. SCSIO 64092]